MLVRGRALEGVYFLDTALRYARSRAHDESYRFFGHFSGEPGLFVDIGANRGQSAVSFRIHNRTYEIASYEPNPALGVQLALVARLIRGPFAFHLHGFADAAGTHTLYLPRIDGVTLTQEGTLDRERLASDPWIRAHLLRRTGCREIEIVETPLRFLRFDDIGCDPDLVKMDVEGGELRVIAGMEATLRRARPIVLVEFIANRYPMRAAMAALGYRGHAHDPGTNRLVPLGADEKPLNVFFVPESRLDALGDRGLIADARASRRAP
jgi:FkbM family methyltransferase